MQKPGYDQHDSGDDADYAVEKDGPDIHQQGDEYGFAVIQIEAVIAGGDFPGKGGQLDGDGFAAHILPQRHHAPHLAKVAAKEGFIIVAVGIDRL